MKRISLLICVSVSLLWYTSSRAQDTVYRRMSVEDVFRIAADSNLQLKAARLGIDIARERTEVARTLRNPNLSASVTASYLGDAVVYDKSFGNKVKVSMPHFGNSLSLQASQLLFKGGAISNSIAIATLQEQLATLSYQRNAMDIKLLLAGNYFELYRLYNQRDVYRRNIELARVRIANISRMYKEGMVTRNDIIRNELLITGLQTAVQQIENNIAILTQQLDIALGFTRNTVILPDSTSLLSKDETEGLDKAMETAMISYPDLQSSRLNVKVAEKGVQAARADRLPALSLSAGNSLTRPLTTVSPARDMYSNGWQAGLGLSYNIASLYNAPKNIQLAKIQLEQQRQALNVQEQTVELNVKTAFIKHRESKQVLANAQKSVQLARENFRIVEKKYLNQMAILADLLDATNAKLEAELQQKNAESTIIYTYYQLKRATGTL